MNCILLSKHHQKIYEKYKYWAKWYKVPVIFLSSINSVFSLPATTPLSQQTVSLSNSMTSLVCSILVSVAMYLKIEDIMEQEHHSSRNFYLLSITTFRELSLDKEHRITEPRVFLDDCLTEYNKLIEHSCISNLKLSDKLCPIDLSLIINTTPTHSEKV